MNQAYQPTNDESRTDLKRLRRIRENTLKLVEYRSEAELAPQVMRLFAEHMGVTGGSLYRRKENSLIWMHSLDPGHQHNEISLPARPDSIIGRLVSHGKPIIISDIQHNRSVGGSGYSGYRNGSILGYPLKNLDGSLMGVLTLHNKIRPPFSNEDLEVGHLIVSQIIGLWHSMEQQRKLECAKDSYLAILSSSPNGVLVEQNGRIVYHNPQAADWLDLGVAGFSKQNFEKLFAHHLLQSGNDSLPPEFDMQIRRDDRWLKVRTSTILYFGAPARLANMVDITERCKAVQTLRDKERLEGQLLQSQKMEAVGRLAGGVAHDFNNLLTGIEGNAALARIDLDPENPAVECIDEISHAVVRAAALNRQLLTFSRKQMIDPKVLNLTGLIEDLRKMLQRVMREDIKLIIHSASPDAFIKADKGQIEQILLNLAINARDAMPAAGSLTLEINRCTLDSDYVVDHPYVTIGKYLHLSVEDTGTGMDPEVANRVFEPFFTTKPKEMGTGLGLSTVYGIVKQHGGSIEVDSQPGKGTCFNLYFPLADSSEKQVETKPVKDEADLPGGNETILLAEDDVLVRNISVKILKKLGYQVIEAENGTVAMALFEREKPPIDLLLTDVVMPGMNGRQLAEYLKRQLSELKILYTSGYAEDTITSRGMLDKGLSFLGKPYRPQDLARRVRETLDA